MLHFLLMALKVIGIIILAVLCIILTILIIVLVTPLRYKMSALAAFEGKKIEGEAHLTWLFKLIKADIIFRNGKPAWRLKIAFKTIMQDGFEDKTENKTEVTQYERKDNKSDELIEDLYTEDEQSTESEISEAKPDKVSDSKDQSSKGESSKGESSTGESSTGESSTGESSSEGRSDGKSDSDEASDQGSSSGKESCDGGSDSESQPECRPVQGEDHAYSETEKEDEKSTSEEKESPSEKVEKERFSYEKIKEKLLGINEKIKTPFRKIDQFQKSLESKLEKLENKVSQLTALKDELLDFINHRTHQKALFKVLKSIKYILKKYLPRKGEANLHFGLDDPYMTGVVFAILSILDPLCGGNIYATPEPDKFMIEGDLSMAGRIRPVHILIALLGIAITPDIWNTIKDARKLSILKK